MADTPSNTYELVALLATAWSILVDELHKELAKVGYGDIRPTHGFAFQLLAPNGATGNELAEHLGVTKQAASQMIDFLEERGYVTRKPHPTDKRGKIVILTQRGWDCIQTVETILAKLEHHWSTVLGSEHMKMLITDLRRVVLDSDTDILSYRLRPTW